MDIKHDLKHEQFAIMVGGGTDAGGYIIKIVGGKVVIEKVPGWDPLALAELSAALDVLKAATKFRTPGLREAAAQSVMAFTQKELGQHVTGNTVLVM